MKYNKTVRLKDGRECLLRNGTVADGQALLEIFIKTHQQTDFLLSYPDECTMSVNDEIAYIKEKETSKNSIEIVAEVDNTIVGSAGFDAVGKYHKLSHRCEFGVSVDRDYWGLGIGRALTEACIECAKTAGYSQIELDVVADNNTAIDLYKSVGFVEYGRNPKGFCSRLSGWQELVLMRLELNI